MTPLKILVVEDDLASLELMVEVFTSLKAEVRPVSDSERAVDVINQEKFDGIFLDLECHARLRQLRGKVHFTRTLAELKADR